MTTFQNIISECNSLSFQYASFASVILGIYRGFALPKQLDDAGSDVGVNL